MPHIENDTPFHTSIFFISQDAPLENFLKYLQIVNFKLLTSRLLRTTIAVRDLELSKGPFKYFLPFLYLDS